MFKSNFKLIHGVPGWADNQHVVTVGLLEDKLTFRKTVVKDSPVVSLSYDQITGTGCYTEKEIIEKSKSVVGRAAVGSLFGPVGAIVGALSGTGTNKRVKTDLFYTISYISSSGEPAMITLRCGVWGCHMNPFDAELKKHLPKKDVESKDFSL